MNATSAPVIAIDGPSASGKGTIAHKVADILGFRYLDSGALYRLVGIEALNAGVLLDDEPRLTPLAAQLDVHFQGGRIILNGADVTEAIRAEVVGVAASKISQLRAVRAALLQRQRDFCIAPGLVADGRDMGSVVFPTAQLKVYLTASAEIRAQRRYKQLMDKGNNVTLPDVLRDIHERDARDTSRKVAPLQQLPDAILVDASYLSISEAVNRVLEAYKRSSVL